MAPAVRVFRQFRASNTRMKAVTLTGLAGVVLAVALLVGVIPAIAGEGAPSGKGVQPSEIEYGGGSGACDADFPGLPSEAAHELWINNPADGTFEGPDGTKVEIDVYDGDKLFDFEFEDPTKAAYDVVVNGGKHNAHYDYDEGSTGPVSADTGLHAPTKGGSDNLYSLSHINICYDANPFADLSVTKTPVGELTDGAFVADVDDTVKFEIVVTNSSLSTLDATGVVVTDTLPTGMEFDSDHNGNGDWSHSNGTVTQTLDESIAPGDEVLLSLFVTITQDAAGSDVLNEVSVSANENDPTPDNDADSVPPVTVRAEISGTKYHDRDTDGVQDVTGEDGLAGWTISAFAVSIDEETQETSVDFTSPPADSATTGADGSYSLSLVADDYVVCESAPNQDLEPGDPSKLPESDLGFTWSWGQSEPSGDNADVCAASNDHEPLGYAITVDGDITDRDFGNHRQVTINCTEANGASFEIPLGGDGLEDDPKSTVIFPADCQTNNLTVAYDVGRSDPDTESGEPGEDDWTQFVVFGGDPTGERIIEQTIIWDIEEADYNEDGTLLTLPSTMVRLDPGGEENPAVLCNTLTGSEPNDTTPHCLYSRVMDEGGDLPVGTIQITEDYLFLGDPFSFR